jgi:hypothetical protein
MLYIISVGVCQETGGVSVSDRTRSTVGKGPPPATGDDDGGGGDEGRNRDKARLMYVLSGVHHMSFARLLSICDMPVPYGVSLLDELEEEGLVWIYYRQWPYVSRKAWLVLERERVDGLAELYTSLTEAGSSDPRLLAFAEEVRRIREGSALGKDSLKQMRDTLAGLPADLKWLATDFVSRSSNGESPNNLRALGWHLLLFLVFFSLIAGLLLVLGLLAR